MVETAQEANWVLSNEEIEAKIADFREQLEYCGKLYTELLNEGVYAHFYRGKDLRETYLPERSDFKRLRMETFG